MGVRKVAELNYNMTTADANNVDGKIPFGRQFDFIGDVETELMILNDGDESLCLGYTDVELYEDAYVGDQLNFRAEMLKVGNTSRKMVFEARKVITPRTDINDSACDVLEEPVVVCRASGTCVVLKDRQRNNK